MHLVFNTGRERVWGYWRFERMRFWAAQAVFVWLLGVVLGQITDEDVTPREGLVVNLADRRKLVREAALHSWQGYVQDAWGMDELQPLSRRGEDTFGGMAVTIVDSLSTLYVMGLMDEFEKGKLWVRDNLDFDKVGEVHVFETVIRVLGGLLSAYDLSGDEIFMGKAEELGSRLGKCFETESGFPYPRCDLNSTACGFHREYGSNVLLAEIGTLQLEFRALSVHARNPKLRDLRDRAEDVVRHIRSITPKNNLGLIPYLLNINTGDFVNAEITLGSPSDSYFEYILKMWIQGGKQEDFFRDMFTDLMKGIFVYMQWSLGNGLTVLREIHSGGYNEIAKMDHFTCYVPGIVVLGMDLAPPAVKPNWLSFARNVTNTCFGMYQWSASGLAGEHINLHADGKLESSGGYLLRPEVVEAIFYMWRTTHDPIYREWGWLIFLRIQKWCRTETAYTTLENADTANPKQSDSMPSFFIAETLKYLYLLFSDDDLLSLDEWVFNTEGHPLRITPDLLSPQG